MRRQSINQAADVRRILDSLAHRGTDVELVVEGKREKFLSRVLAVDPPGPFRWKFLGHGENQMSRQLAIDSDQEAPGKTLMIEELVPEAGDGALRQSQELEVAFWMDRSLCRFHSTYVGPFDESRPQGHVIDFPSEVDMETRRTEDRITPPFPEFYTAVFRLPQDGRDDREVELAVLNYSSHGLGLLVENEDYPLLKPVRRGERIPDITLYGEGLLTRLTGIVRHTTEIMTGENLGHFVLGLESEQELGNHFAGPGEFAS